MILPFPLLLTLSREVKENMISYTCCCILVVGLSYLLGTFSCKGESVRCCCFVSNLQQLIHFRSDFLLILVYTVPNSKVHGANMGPTWGRQDSGGPHAVPMNLAIWGVSSRHDCHHKNGSTIYFATSRKVHVYIHVFHQEFSNLAYDWLAAQPPSNQKRY